MGDDSYIKWVPETKLNMYFNDDKNRVSIFTYDIYKSVKFDTEADCKIFCDGVFSMEDILFKPTEHIFSDNI